MTPARRAELEAKVAELFQCESFGYAVSRSDVLGLVQQVEREVWTKAVKINEDLIRDHDPGAPGVSVLAVAAKRMRQQSEGR
jgi:hypothetical protein